MNILFFEESKMPSIAVGVAPVQVVDRNAGRKTITFTNRSIAGQVITIDMGDQLGLTILNGGYVLAPGAAISFMVFFDGNDIKDKWSAVSDVAAGLLYYRETVERA